MNKELFIENKKNLLDELENLYWESLKDKVITLQDYNLYNLNFVGSLEISKKIENKFITECSDWKVGDKFKQIKTIFYKSSEEIVESFIWGIEKVYIFYDNEKEKYYFNYRVSEFTERSFKSMGWFNDLQDVDDKNENGVRTKFHFIRV